MKSIIKAIAKKVASWFSNPEPVENKPVQESTPRSPEPIPAPVPGQKVPADMQVWVDKAVEVIASFEGNGVDWGNPVGNFDGAYLTCGVIGFTWKYNNQPPMIREFVKRHGEPALRALMPRYGGSYIQAANLGESGGAHIVKAWSGGSYNLPEVIKSELNAFWKSPGMLKIQQEKIMELIGNWGIKKMYETQKFFGNPEPKFEHLVFWMDQATLNGTGKTPNFEEYKAVSTQTIIGFCANQGGYNKADLRKNGALWAKMLNDSPFQEVVMFKLAYLRSIRASSDFKGTVMNRRGTLALGKGYVNGSLRSYAWA